MLKHQGSPQFPTVFITHFRGKTLIFSGGGVIGTKCFFFQKCIDNGVLHHTTKEFDSALTFGLVGDDNYPVFFFRLI